MQRTRVLLVAASVACAPLGCQTVSDVFNEPPAEPQRTEREEERERQEEARETAQRDRMERRERRDEERAERRESAREARRERELERAERQEERREERRRSREARRTARDYMAPSSCPAALDSTVVTLVDITDGIALDFRAEDEADVEVVRDRARRLMDSQREVRSSRELDDPRLEALPPARVEYDIQPDGARIELKVDDEADFRELRTQLRERVDIMRDEGRCPRELMTMRMRRGGREG